jgi:hypothetical protein
MQVFAMNVELSCIITFIIYRVFENKAQSKISHSYTKTNEMMIYI